MKKIFAIILILILVVVLANFFFIFVIKFLTRPTLVSSGNLPCESLNLGLKRFEEVVGFGASRYNSYLYLDNKRLGRIVDRGSLEGGIFPEMASLRRHNIAIAPAYLLSSDNIYTIKTVEIDPKIISKDAFDEIGACLLSNSVNNNSAHNYIYIIYASEDYISGNIKDSPYHFQCSSGQYLTSPTKSFLCVKTPVSVWRKTEFSSLCMTISNFQEYMGDYGELFNSCRNNQGKNILEFHNILLK